MTQILKSLPDISLEELLKMKEVMEKARWRKKGIAEAEFGWLYTPGKGLYELERVVSGTMSTIFQMIGQQFSCADFKNVDALAHIHNHPSGFVLLNMFDLNSDLDLFLYNRKIKYAMTASTKRGNVSGFLVLERFGKQKNLKASMSAAKECIATHHKLRINEMENEPAKFKDFILNYEGAVFAIDEYFLILKETLQIGEIKNYALPMPGYRFRNWRFEKQ